MKPYHPNILHPFDGIRLRESEESLKTYFRSLTHTDENKGIELLNRPDLGYASLFVLRPQIDKSGLYLRLSSRNQLALKITDEILERKPAQANPLCLQHKKANHSTLRWMLETGFSDDGLSNEYDQVLDSTVNLLVKVYRDITVLPLAAELIFKRHRRGAYIYDLLWGFFESGNPYSLAFIAKRLNSQEPADRSLALKLLGFIPDIASQDPYTAFQLWMDENAPFLYYTGESFQKTGNPKPYAVNLDAKYLCRPLFAVKGKEITGLGSDERKLLDEVHKLDENSRAILAKYSVMLHRQDENQWKTWLHSPVSQQLRTARAVMGGWRP